MTDLMNPNQKDVTTTINELIIPEADDLAITKMDDTLIQFRIALSNPDLPDIRRMYLQAKAITTLEELVTPGMIADLKKLMNSPLGFKTDRDPARPSRQGEKVEPYDDTTIKRCVIVGWLAGARMTQNEFNIISGQAYLTKQFYKKAIDSFPLLTDFKHVLGAPDMIRDRAAAIDAMASWKINGKPFSVEYRKGTMDLRLIVINNSGMSTDALWGKAERKLFARVYTLISGIHTENDEGEDDVATVTVEQGKIDLTPAQQMERQHQAEADAFFIEFAGDIDAQTEITQVTEKANNRRGLIANQKWPDEIKRKLQTQITQAVKQRIEAIRDSRGDRSNRR